MKTVEINLDPTQIKLLRMSKGLTQIELAERAGVSADTITRWENRKSVSPHPSGLKRLADALGVNPRALLRDVA